MIDTAVTMILNALMYMYTSDSICRSTELLDYETAHKHVLSLVVSDSLHQTVLTIYISVSYAKLTTNITVPQLRIERFVCVHEHREKL